MFGAAQPLLSNISNTGGPAYDMKAEVCGGKRAATASEADDEPDPNASAGFAFAAPTLPKSGAELLQTLPPSMPPVVVYVGTRSAPQDLSTAYAEDEKPKKKPGATKQAAKPAGTKPGSGTETASAGEGKPADKPAAKPKPATASASATSGTAAKPKPAADDASQKKQVQPATPVTAGTVPAPKPKPKPKPADDPAAAPAPKPAT